MKIAWLNLDRTEALLTRGHLWWKRVALVQRVVEGKPGCTAYARISEGSVINWQYVPSKLWCAFEVDRQLDVKRDRERIWCRPSVLPPARLLP